MDAKSRRPSVRFPSTDWSEVRHAAGDTCHALDRLLRRYLPALKAYLVTVKRLSADEADDLLQDFVVEKIVQDQLIAHADHHRGRFRTFLLTVLNNYQASHWRRRHTRRRAPAGKLVSLEDQGGVADHHTTPEAVYELAWARQVLGETLERMQRTCREQRRPDLWGVFDGRVVAPLLRQTAATPYEQLVARFAFASPAQASNALVTAKRLYVRTLRGVIAEYARDDREIDEEVAELKAILARAAQG